MALTEHGPPSPSALALALAMTGRKLKVKIYPNADALKPNEVIM